MTTISYTGAGQANTWTDPKNWKGGVVPGSADTALLNAGKDASFSGGMAVNNLMMLKHEAITFTGALTTYGVGNCKGLMVCDDATVTFAPGSTLNDGGVLQAGVDAVGTFIARGTSALATTIHSKSGVAGKEAAGTGTITIDDASWTNTGAVLVGNAGHGTLNVVNGGVVNVGGNMVLGLAAASTGLVTVSSGGAIAVAGAASVGGGDASKPGGVGTLMVNAGSSFDVQHTLRVTSGSVVGLAGGTVSGADLTGGLEIEAGGKIAGFGTLATRTGGGIGDSGTIEAKGGLLAVSGRIGGSGSLQIDDNSTISITNGTVQLPKISFSGVNGTLALTKGAVVVAALDGFAAGDKITMAGVTAASWSSVTDVLTLSGGGKTIDRLHLGGSFASDAFTVTQAGGVGVISLHT